jgi:vacuolar-type H+-ATPase subunit I/STV1
MIRIFVGGDGLLAVEVDRVGLSDGETYRFQNNIMQRSETNTKLYRYDTATGKFGVMYSMPLVIEKIDNEDLLQAAKQVLGSVFFNWSASNHFKPMYSQVEVQYNVAHKREDYRRNIIDKIRKELDEVQLNWNAEERIEKMLKSERMMFGKLVDEINSKYAADLVAYWSDIDNLGLADTKKVQELREELREMEGRVESIRRRLNAERAMDVVGLLYLDKTIPTIIKEAITTEIQNRFPH